MNGAALCHMHMGHLEEAETLLLEALNKVGAAERGWLHAPQIWDAKVGMERLGWKGWEEVGGTWAKRDKNWGSGNV